MPHINSIEKESPEDAFESEKRNERVKMPQDAGEETIWKNRNRTRSGLMRFSQ